MDVAYSALPVRLIGHHTGISLGFYGTSHHATEDIAIFDRSPIFRSYRLPMVRN